MPQMIVDLRLDQKESEHRCSPRCSQGGYSVQDSILEKTELPRVPVSLQANTTYW